MHQLLFGVRSLTLGLAVFGSLSPAAHAQTHLHMPASLSPELSDLGNWAEVPWTRPDARMQQFFSEVEVGASSFVATGLDLRFDGPIPMVGAPGPFTIQRLTVKIGTSTVPVPGPVFDSNVTGSPTIVFDQPITYWPDQGSETPAPWGGLNGGLSMAFTTPVAVSIPPGGWLVIEISVAGNSLTGSAHAMLDGEVGPGGPYEGLAFSSLVGCSIPGGQPATITSTGVHAPGAVHFLGGSNLGANSPVIALIGLSDTQAAFGPLPFNLPGTSCFAFTSWDLSLSTVADAAGSIRSNDPRMALPLSTHNVLTGLQYYAQLAALVPGANRWNLVFSDKRTVQLGGINPLSMGMYAVWNGDSSTAAYGDAAQEFGFAMRLQTQ